jgi:hypothetical protein
MSLEKRTKKIRDLIPKMIEFKKKNRDKNYE